MKTKEIMQSTYRGEKSFTVIKMRQENKTKVHNFSIFK